MRRRIDEDETKSSRLFPIATLAKADQGRRAGPRIRVAEQVVLNARVGAGVGNCSADGARRRARQIPQGRAARERVGEKGQRIDAVVWLNGILVRPVVWHRLDAAFDDDLLFL